MTTEAIYAAPYFNSRSTGPGNGMELSYDEILRLLDLMGRSPDGFVFKGSTDYIGEALKPQRNAAVDDLIARAMASSPEDPLHVIALAAITNVSSAILLEPRIIERMVVCWLGGHSFGWPDTKEFNLKQDVPGARVLFDCGVPLVMLPCMGVVEYLSTTIPELERYVEPTGKLGAFLTDRVRGYEKDHTGWSKAIWDMAPVAYLNNADWTPSILTHSPVLNSEVNWSVDRSRHLIRYAHRVERDAIFRDFFVKLARFGR
jgi:inosine-uridine nucleoside N-ribohydrolase